MPNTTPLKKQPWNTTEPVRYVYFTGKDLTNIYDLTPYKKYKIEASVHPDSKLRYLYDDVGFKITICMDKDDKCAHLDDRYKWQYVTPLYAPAGAKKRG